jgi:hypothetical protein
LELKSWKSTTRYKKFEGEIHTSVLSYTETPAASQEAHINWATTHLHWKLSC